MKKSKTSLKPSSEAARKPQVERSAIDQWWDSYQKTGENSGTIEEYEYSIKEIAKAAWDAAIERCNEEMP